MSEGESFQRIVREIDRAVATLDGLTAAQLEWKPVANANSVRVLVAHTVGAVQRHILQHVAGGAPGRPRETEFSDPADADAIRARWKDVRPRIVAALERLDAATLERKLPPPQEDRTGRDMLVHAVAHASEHAGQAELTRDLAKSAQVPPG